MSKEYFFGKAGDNLHELPEPVGKFIMDQPGLTPLVTGNSYYWHYKDVITLLTRYREQHPTGPAWVKASERLPEKDGYYCFKANGGFMGAYMRTGSNGNRWWCDSAGGTIRNWKNCEWLDEKEARP